MKNTNLKTIPAILALLLLAGVATAADLPAPAVRIWAPAGDIVGTDNNLTLDASSMDRHGADAKRAEDWQLVDKTAGGGLFGWHTTSAGGYLMSFRGHATSAAASGITGAFLATGSSPGKTDWRLRFRNGNHSYDPTSEMRAPGFAAPPEPQTLNGVPVYEWRMADIAAGYRFSESFKLTAGLDRKCRKGDKGSLLRVGAGGDEVPAVKMYDTTSNEFWGQASFGSGGFGGDLRVAYRAADGDRVMDTRRVYGDDRTLLRTNLDLRYDVGRVTSLFAHAGASELKDQGTQNTLAIDSKATTSGGQLGLVSRLGQATWFRLAATVRKQDTDAALDANLVDRERSSTDLQAMVSYRGFKRTRLSLDYRYRSADLTETGTDASTVHKLDQDQTYNDLDFKLRHKFSRQVGLRFKVGYGNRETKNAHTWQGTAWYTGMPERKRNTLDGELVLRTRPGRTLRLDLGARAWDRTIERSDMPGTETTWSAAHGFANLNWTASHRLSLYGTVAYGTDKYELSGAPVPDAGMGPVMQDGTTLRFVPGATLYLLDRLTFDAMYEAIRYEDTGNESNLIAVLQSDSDRMLLRAAWALNEDLDLTATYRRHEFMEHRWDNYITDLYALSASGRF
ncbi:hypothetical protein DRQ50_01050 [bacterium]|nr:MAG: hypothetical protein DRQ50_01050 [bacterium]